MESWFRRQSLLVAKESVSSAGVFPVVFFTIRSPAVLTPARRKSPCAKDISWVQFVFKIKMTLSQKGIDSELLKRTIENIKNDNEDPDFYSAIKICKRRRIGPYRPDANKEMFLKKDIGVLARAGFSYDTSMQVLNIDKQELKILEKKI